MTPDPVSNPPFNAGYAFFVGLALIVGFVVKTREEKRLVPLPLTQRRWVTAGALIGAMVGAKLGLLLYLPVETWRASIGSLLLGEWGPRTILGALFFGFIGVELAKKALGITVATGDPYAIALPLGQSIGRLGCFVGGCCYGAPIFPGSTVLHPAQLYEAVLDLVLAVTLFRMRGGDRPAGLLFRYYLLGYAGIRFAMDFFRGDEKQMAGPLSYAQWFCLACSLYLAWDVRRRRVVA
jgi:phosphatidylglycerol:prolipoprotein diacylglycerol transferase